MEYTYTEAFRTMEEILVETKTCRYLISERFALLGCMPIGIFQLFQSHFHSKVIKEISGVSNQIVPCFPYFVLSGGHYCTFSLWREV